MWWERSSKIARRWSCDRPHHSADLRMGINAAEVDEDRPNGACCAASALCSSAVTYRSWPTTPRRIQDPDLELVFSLDPSMIASLVTGSSDAPLIASIRATDHWPLSPPTNVTLSDSIGVLEPTTTATCSGFEPVTARAI